MQKPATPKLKELSLLAGIQRDIFRQANSAAIGAEQRALDAFEEQSAQEQTTSEVQAIRTAGLTHLATYREMRERGRHQEADLFRIMNNRAISDEQDRLARSSSNDDGPEAA